MCGGELDIAGKEHVCECPFCGVTQTIPNVDEEKSLQLFNRATFLLKTCEYDKASGIYEKIISDQGEQAEAYWGLCLCKYGIEYVDDPKTSKKIPTCHRTLTNSILKDSDYLKALELADVVARKLYEEEAKYIDVVQKKILEISKSEEPYDIFICYKETDKAGRRTPDSVIAEEIFDALTEKGYKVFFSKISLEDKIGQEYEPYIFAALTSAKVMLAIGTREEYFNAPWVKNEWSRFLKLCNSGEKKYLIPCYKDISPYEMPEEFVNLQSQDLGKLGYLQDLVKGINKLMSKYNTSSKTSIDSKKSEIQSTFDEIDSLISKGNFKEAKKALKKLDDKYDYNKHKNLFDDDGYPIDDIKNDYAWYNFLKFKESNKIEIEKYYGLDDYARTIPLAWDDGYLWESQWTQDEDLEAAIKSFVDKCKANILENDYNEANKKKQKARNSLEFKQAYECFKKLGDYLDSKEQSEYCMERAIDLDDPVPFIKDMLVKSIRKSMSFEESSNILKALNEYNDSQLDIYKEYLRSVLGNSSSSNLTSSLNDLENEKEKIIENDFELANLYELKEKLTNEKETKLKAVLSDFESTKAKLEDEIKELKSERDSTMIELSKCGLFAVKEKKALKEKVNFLDSKITKVKKENETEISDLKNKCNNQTREIEQYYDERIFDCTKNIKEKEVSNGLKKINDEIENLKNKINEALSQSVSKPEWEPNRLYFIKDCMGITVPCYIIGKSPQVLVNSVALQIELGREIPDENGIYRIHGLEIIKQIDEMCDLSTGYKTVKLENYYVLLPTKWRILKKSNTNNRLFFTLLAIREIGKRSFNNNESLFVENNNVKRKDGKSAFDYETSDLRIWLNQVFYNQFFSEEEKKLICNTSLNQSIKNEASDHKYEDKVFLLSLEELKALDIYQIANSELTQDEWTEFVSKSYNNALTYNEAKDIEYDQIDDFEVAFNDYVQYCRNAMETSIYFKGPRLLRTTFAENKSGDIGPCEYGLLYENWEGTTRSACYFKASSNICANVSIIPSIVLCEESEQNVSLNNNLSVTIN